MNFLATKATTVINSIAMTNQAELPFGNETECNQVHSYNSSALKCLFVENVDSCQSDEGFINYINFSYCIIGSEIYSVILLLLWILILFIALVVAADEFLCSSLLVTSRTLRLSDNVAGVTVLAFGNGAPDIFTSISGIQASNPDIVIGELLGAGIFIITVVAGAILFMSDLRMSGRPFMRDVLFYMLATFLVWLIYFNQKITLTYSIVFIVVYIIYIFVVVFGGIINNACSKQSGLKNEVEAENNNNANNVSSTSNSCVISNGKGLTFHRTYLRQASKTIRKPSVADLGIGDVVLRRFNFPNENSLLERRRSSQSQPYKYHHHGSNTIFSIAKYQARRKNTISDESFVEIIDPLPKPRPFLKQISQINVLSLSSKEVVLSQWKELLVHISPIDCQSWKEDVWYRKIFSIIKAPIYFVLLITTPIVDEESEKNNWCKWLSMLQIIIGPQAFILLTKLSSDGNLIHELILLAVSLFLVLIIQLTSTLEKPPVYHRIFGFLGFIMSIGFIYSIANEVVNALTAIGFIFNLSDMILGMTILAWGNSLGDLVSNLSMARHGFPKMALSACFGGPLLNALLGIGVPFTLMFIKDKQPSVKLNYQSHVTLLYSVLTFSLASTLIIMILNRFQSYKWLGYFLIITYAVFFISAGLQEFKII